MTDKIDIIYQLFRDVQEELREKDVLISELNKKLTQNCVAVADKVGKKEFHTLSLKVERMTTRVMMISGIAGLIGGGIFLGILELIFKIFTK